MKAAVLRRLFIAALGAVSMAMFAVSVAHGQPATAPGTGASAGNAVRTAAPPAEYLIGAGDVVRIVVFQNPDLTLETRVTEAGVVSYPLLGSVRLGGLSVTAAEGLIADGLRNGNFVKNPQVSLVVTQVRGNQASVLGQVNRPGRYPLEMADMRLSDLLAIAGGVSATGADTVVVTGRRNGQPFREEVDLPSVFAPGGAARDRLILNNDVIWVERQPVVYIYGEVQRPGQIRLERDMTLLQALATGGGLTQRGTEKGIKVNRKSPDGRVLLLDASMTDKLRDGDVVYVRESLF